MSILRKCNKCGQPFVGVKQQRLCPDCRNKAQKAPRMIQHTCLECGIAFTGGPRAMYCEVCREDRKKAANRRCKSAAKAGKTRKLGSTDLCTRCGKEYIVNSGLQRYCKDCAPIALAEKMAPIKRAHAAKQRQAEGFDKHSRQVNGTICVVCGKPFTATKSTNTCSPECAKRQRSIRQAKADKKRRSK